MDRQPETCTDPAVQGPHRTAIKIPGIWAAFFAVLAPGATMSDDGTDR